MMVSMTVDCSAKILNFVLGNQNVASFPSQLKDQVPFFVPGRFLSQDDFASDRVGDEENDF